MTSSRMSGSSSTTSTRLGMAPLSYQPGTGDAGSALGGLGSVEARSRGGQQAQQAQSLAQRVPVDPEHAGRLQLVPGRQLERQAQQRHLHARHHGPVQPPVTRRYGAADDPREDGVQQPVELLHVDSALHARDRKSTRLNSSHPSISYAVFCLKKKKSSIVVHTDENKKKKAIKS